AACGLKNVLTFKSDTGMMGGKTAHEFMLLSEGGEDSLVICESCGYRANMDVAVSEISNTEPSGLKREEVYTPGITDIAALAKFLQISERDIAKAAVFKRADTKTPVVVFLRGDLEVNEAKLRRVAGCEILPLGDDFETSLRLGFVGAIGLAKEEAEIYFDRSLEGKTGFVTGANREDYHITGVNIEECSVDSFHDLAKAREGDSCPECGSPLTVRRGIEVGNIFQLSDRYSKAMNMTYTDAENILKNPLMGCYGIGIGRLMACVIEDNHDDFGPVWPRAIAPYDLHICCLSANDEGIAGLAAELYADMNGYCGVLMDDRQVSAGVQFADADLIGAPVRVILSRRNTDNNVAEVVSRDKKNKTFVSLDTLSEFLRDLVKLGWESV
ncbi:MAG: His/Gly/Thr/Pro-type tRNA ligase C-terminal domain-containing protein, partial [Oscillospiraceae bacterium]|nr:His/Gly/Thr/Pro-type tRNA ligase C-terminal domain-containing protein [Oscillospiraceae bacterium]